MNHLIIGTAGHIDHGKTTLIRALTGIETDRLEEEKKRGITIELGFAYMDGPDGEKIGIVDVPGHEKFIKNMLAGAGGVDLVLLVIAADEGVMPQTKEHLNILSLLGADKGMVVITKKDMVEPEWLEMIEEDIRLQLEDSFLDGADIIKVSAVTGDGIDELKTCIFDKLSDSVAKDNQAPLRLPIDRVFTIGGHGTVITGTQTEGSLTVGDSMMIYPSLQKTKVKSIQVHNASVETSYPGQRVAVNLAGLKKEDINRGETLAALDSMHVTMILDVQLSLLNEISRPLVHRSRVRFYHGTSETLGRIVLLDNDSLDAGQSAYVQLRLEEKVALKVGDPFVIRYYSPLETIGGGKVLDINPVKHKRFNEAVIGALETKASGSDIDILESAIERYSKDLMPLSFIAKQLAKPVAAFNEHLKMLVEDGLVLALTDDLYCHKTFFEYLSVRSETYLKEFHKTNPLKSGMDRQEFRSKLLPGQEVKLVDVFIQQLVDKKIIGADNLSVWLKSFKVEVDPKQERALEQILNTLKTSAFTPPTKRELIESLERGVNGEAIIKKLLSDGLVVKADEKLYYHKDIIEHAKAITTAYVEANGQITLAEFRDLIGASRKYAIAILEYFDRNRFTRKVDDYRVLK